MIVERIQTLCKASNTTLSQLEKELSFGNGTIRRWNDNSPSMDRVLKVADYFKVSVDYLLQEKRVKESANEFNKN